MATAQSARPVVLVVDDDPDLRLLTQMQLAEGFDVVEAANGKECIEKASVMSPDVILLDIMMPEMSGAEVLEALSSDPATKDIPVIFLSALDALEHRVQGLENGAVDYITKATDGREVFARVSAVAKRRLRELIGTVENGDHITKLEDRRAFEIRLLQEVSRSARSLAPLTVMLIDIDGLDQINRVVGESDGDRVLSETAQKLRETLRLSDVFYRYGGDEFAVILPDTDVATGYIVAERCREAIRKISSRDESTQCSIGLADFSVGRSAEELTAKAEIALFRAKESGGNRTWRADDPRRHALNAQSLSQELTEREWDVLGHLIHRRTEHDIARRLGVSPGTVRSHKARIRRKLNVSPNIRLSDFARSNLKEIVAHNDREGEADG